MRIVINPNYGVEKNCIAAHRLIEKRLSVLALWREVTGGHDESMILMAVMATTGGRYAARGSSSRPAYPASTAAEKRSRGCSIKSVADATGMNRETARRAIYKLIERGILERYDDRSIGLKRDRLKGKGAARISEVQLKEFARTANDLLSEGVLIIDG